MLLPTATACPTGWAPAPNASWPAACYGVLAERASSLRECVEACARQGAVPVCIGSEEENDFTAELVGRGSWAWLGRYQSDTSGGAGEGWASCVAGAAPDFANWAAGEPNDEFGPEDCAVVNGRGEWRDQPCDVPFALGWTAAPRCLCAGPTNASASFTHDLGELEATWAAHMRETRATVAVLYPLAVVVALLPSLLLLCRRAYTAGTSCEGEQSAAGTSCTLRRTSRTATVRTLRAAHRSATRRRVQVSGAFGQAGWALLVFGLLPLIMQILGHSTDAVVGSRTCWMVLCAPGTYLLFLALLPTDTRAIRAVCAVLVALCLLLIPLFLFYILAGLRHGDLAVALGLRFPLALLFLSAAMALAPTLLCHGCRAGVMEPRQALRRLWIVVRLFSVGLGVLFISYWTTRLVIDPALAVDPNYPGGIATGATFLLCALLATAANRGRLHRWLGRLGGRGSEAEEAAAVAALVGGADPAKALERAAALFRCLPADSLVAADLAGVALGASTSAQDLAAKTRPAALGEVTAFLSHSWSDEQEVPGAKYATVERWAAAHKRTTSQEPTLWLDKACLDQDNIEQSLACLPVFLAGCQKLLIVAGPTYTSRLWCVMEIFTFLQMGGDLERIDIFPLVVSPADLASSRDKRARFARLTEQFATFDAAKAQCFLAKDRQRLLAVVEAGFGDFKDFNMRVRAIFAARVGVASRPLSPRLAVVSVAAQGGRV